MTKKHYEAIADVLARNASKIDADVRAAMIMDLSRIMKSDNPNFDERRFMIACTATPR